MAPSAVYRSAEKPNSSRIRCWTELSDVTCPIVCSALWMSVTVMSLYDVPLTCCQHVFYGIIRPALHVGKRSHEDIGLDDGSTHRFGAGTALLAKDITGRGHTTLRVGGEPVIQAVIPLAETESHLHPYWESRRNRCLPGSTTTKAFCKSSSV